ncbi:MAG: L,D-transpeptidase [Hyphomicrobiales bacterium]|nr:L,D-transpeptidase [Hyphomicrobiales bacterium]
MRPLALLLAGIMAAFFYSAVTAQASSFFLFPQPSEPDPAPAVEDPRLLASPIPRERVAYAGPYAPGSIIINTSERRLYFVLPDHQAFKYGIGVGRPGFTWAGVTHIAAKREWPDWTPPAQMLRRRPDLPRHMAGGIDNPLGARAMYLAGTLYRIHGSNEPDTIGQAVSSGCIRMTNGDVIDLYGRARVGATVVVVR